MVRPNSCILWAATGIVRTFRSPRPRLRMPILRWSSKTPTAPGSWCGYIPHIILPQKQNLLPLLHRAAGPVSYTHLDVYKRQMVGTPSIMLELSNPCASNVVFGNNGLPMAQREGHGLGMQSISAFCRKNGAVCQCDQTGGWFRLRLVL